MQSAEPRLAIIVPALNGLDALDGFVSHMGSYFERDKKDRLLARDLVLVEGAMSAGAMLNAAALHVGKWAASLCFHPAVFFPIWADYAAEPSPAALAAYSADKASAPALAYGPLMLSPQHFEAVDGFPEAAPDYFSAMLALNARLKAAGIAVAQRGGTFAVDRHMTPPGAVPSGAGLSARRAQIVSASRKPRPRIVTMGGQPDMTPAVIVLKASSI